jgi:tetratricopeptide (TPR) repeat protein
MMKKILIFSIAALMIISCAKQVKKTPPPIEPTETPEIMAENYVSDAIDYYQNQKYAEAITSWKKALQIIPQDAEVQNFIGLAFHRTGKLDSAVIHFQKAVELDSQYYQAWNNLGYMQFLQGNYVAALGNFYKALKANPNYEQASLNFARASEILDGRLQITAFELVENTTKMDSLELQIANYRKALSIDSNYVDAWNNLGVAYFYYSNLDSAVICFKRALDKNPDYPPAHNNAGYVLDVLGEYDQAIAHYQRAIQLRPNYLIAMANLLDSYMHKKDYDSARVILDTLRKAEPNNDLVRERIEEYQEILYGNMPQGGQ